jgi:hypothetical protein
MKRSAILIAAWLCLTSANAQLRTEKHIDFSGKESVELNIQIADSITIRTWDKNEIYATASVNVNDNKDNDAYQISFGESGKTAEIKASFKKDFWEDKKNNCCTRSDIRWKIYIPAETEFSVETINGDIIIAGKTSAMKVNTISGFIDLAVPASKNADLEFSTITGTVFTNHTLSANSKPSGHSSDFRQKLNNGGPLIKLATISGDIFFRKAD